MQLHIALAIIEGCDPGLLDDEASLMRALEAAIAAGGFSFRGSVSHRFDPQGFTAAAIIGESHLALHTWPEDRKLFVDIASCTTRSSVEKALAAMVACLPNARIEHVEIKTFPEPQTPT